MATTPVKPPVIADVQVTVRAILHPEPDGGYWAEVPALPGVITEGDALEEVLANVKEAAELWLEGKHDDQVRGRSLDSP